MAAQAVSNLPAAAGQAATGPVVSFAPASRQSPLTVGVFLPIVAAMTAWAVHAFVPARQFVPTLVLYPRLLLAIAAVAIVALVLQAVWKPARPWVRHHAPLIAAAVGVLIVWDLVTWKFDLLPKLYFPGPSAVLQAIVDNWYGRGGLMMCVVQSLLLLFCGYSTGVITGVICGVIIGWSKAARYWGMPLVKIVGPIPATAWIPIALVLFPSAFMSATALVALAVWFPVTMLTASGISNVRVSYLDVARTLGASRWFLIFRVAIPAAMPSIFLGLFMGLGTSFLTLVIAEGLGVKAGLGWYMSWARESMDYTRVYSALVLMALFFSCIMTLLFKVRDWVLVWQKGTIKW